MDEPYRRAFNEAFTNELYEEYQSELRNRLNTTFEFRLAETPVFVPDHLRKRLFGSAHEILGQLCDPARLRKMQSAIPARWHVPGMNSLPSFTQLDFAVVRGPDNELTPRLIELQGFPSLTAMQVVLCDAWSRFLGKIPGLDADWSCWFSGLNRSGFLNLARRTILGQNAPENVILMDIDPPSQKTYPDFSATRLLFGVDSVCPTSLVREGRRLFRRIDGGQRRLIPVHRIYNRVVFDELERKSPSLPFDYREELEVEWAPHPNWYWIWSKYSLPYLDHPCVPRAVFLSELSGFPADLSSRYVLKPLFSFAGGGVKVEPRPEDIDRIPPAERRFWCLQEKIDYEPALKSVEGAGVKVEIRLMFLKPDDEERPVLAQNLCRLSRGAMMGVDFNKSYSWVGASIGLWPVDT
jgi:hypothetical protein